jgi:hypothetical protein
MASLFSPVRRDRQRVQSPRDSAPYAAIALSPIQRDAPADHVPSTQFVTRVGAT